MDHLSRKPIKSQLALWSHFQNQRAAAFDASQPRLEALLRQAERRVPGRSLLNIGCGNGYLERTARQRGWNVISVDPDGQSIEKLKSIGIDARCGMIQSLPVESEGIDVAICTEVLEHILPEFLETGIRELSRVLGPKGVLIGTVPYRESLVDNEVFCPYCENLFHRWGHQQAFDEAKMTALLDPYFKVLVARQALFPAWRAPNWKTRVSALARFAFSLVGVYGASTNLLFIAVKRDT
jgi:SAM-dependent methyltransferase